MFPTNNQFHQDSCGDCDCRCSSDAKLDSVRSVSANSKPIYSVLSNNGPDCAVKINFSLSLVIQEKDAPKYPEKTNEVESVFSSKENA